MRSRSAAGPAIVVRALVVLACYTVDALRPWGNGALAVIALGATSRVGTGTDLARRAVVAAPVVVVQAVDDNEAAGSASRRRASGR